MTRTSRPRRRPRREEPAADTRADAQAARVAAVAAAIHRSHCVLTGCGEYDPADERAAVAALGVAGQEQGAATREPLTLPDSWYRAPDYEDEPTIWDPSVGGPYGDRPVMRRYVCPEVFDLLAAVVPARDEALEEGR